MMAWGWVGAAAAGALDDGKAALVRKDPAAAVVAFEQCLRDLPDDVECRWELGWAYWMQRDWVGVVSAWEEVERRDPGHDALRESLATARDQVRLEGVLADLRARAPRTVAPTAGATLRVRAVGDLMIGTTFPAGVLPPDDAVGTFGGVRDWLQDADLTFGNFEGPLCEPPAPSDKCKNASSPTSCYAFVSPPRYAGLFQAAGFDLGSTANNHAGDFGEACRLQTEQALDQVGIAHSGRPGDLAFREVGGLRVAMVGFHTSDATHNVNDLPRAREIVAALAQSQDLVIVSFHGGAEGSKALHVPQGHETFYNEDRGDLRAFAHAVVEAGADLVLGHGPHVLRAMEVYQGRLVAYSLGNFATYGRFNLSGNLGVGAVLEAQLATDGRFVGGRILPTVQEGEGRPVKDTQGRAIDLVRLLSGEDFPTTAVVVAQDGTLAARP